MANEMQEEAALQLADERNRGGASAQGEEIAKAGGKSAAPEGNNGVGRASTGESADLMEVDELVMLPVSTKLFMCHVPDFAETHASQTKCPMSRSGLPPQPQASCWRSLNAYLACLGNDESHSTVSLHLI